MSIHLTPKEGQVLDFLRSQAIQGLASTSNGEIADFANISKPFASLCVKRLAEKGAIHLSYSTVGGLSVRRVILNKNFI